LVSSANRQRKPTTAALCRAQLGARGRGFSLLQCRDAYANGKVSSITLNGTTTILSNVLYSPFGPTMGWTWGNSTLVVREYDLDGKITDIDSAGLKTYSYDHAFRITGITDASNGSLSQTYGYDNCSTASRARRARASIKAGHTMPMATG
jgi:hypothetical protein